MRKIFILIFSFFASAIAEEIPPPINKLHILYLTQSKEYGKAVDLYEQYHLQVGRHDFEILHQMGIILLEQAARNEEPEKQLLGIFGCSLAGISASADILETAVQSAHPQTQVAAVQLLGQMQDDRCDELLNKAMFSDFFFTRIEAAHLLAMRKSPAAVGQIESLMHRLPPQFRFFFPEFFALIGTKEAIGVLKQLMNDPYHHTRIEAILSAARYGRDDLLPIIRTRASHLNVAEQEACAAAFGWFKDTKGLPTLIKLANSPTPSVKLAACRALYQLGQTEFKDRILALAKEKNLHAIALLSEIAGSEEILLPLLKDDNLTVRFNASLSLLSLRDSRCVSSLKQFLLRDTRDYGFQPHVSVGNALLSWKVVPSAEQHAKREQNFDMNALTLKMREEILRSCLELPEADFIDICRHILDIRQLELIPCMMSLLENHQTPAALALLKDKSQAAGEPLVRCYCHLALFRLKEPGDHEKAIYDWVGLKSNHQMIQFRSNVPRNLPLATSTFELTPQESSRLLIDCYTSLADRQDPKCIDILLKGIKEGHPNNRPVLAGLLIRSIH